MTELPQPVPPELPKQVEHDAQERRSVFRDLVMVSPAFELPPPFADASLDVVENTKMTAWAAVCSAQASAVEPLRAQIAARMASGDLLSLWSQNEAFLQTLATFEAAAASLKEKGRPRLLESLEAWRRDTQTTSKMVQFIWNSRQVASQAAAVATPTPAAPSFSRQRLFGIWDMTLRDGRRAELALNDGSFTYWLLDNSYAFWGTWSLEPGRGNLGFLCLKRGGGYPVKFYGPLGSSDVIYPDNEIWNINAADENKITFATVPMTRRATIDLPLVTARIAEVESGFKMADMRDRNNAVFSIAQHNAVDSVQSSMWDYINSGVGRVH